MTNYKGVIPGFLILFAAGVLYRKYQDKVASFENEGDEELIRKYLLNENVPYGLKKPVMWIHVPYKMNARMYKDFGARNTENLNEPYLYLTIKSIVDRCSSAFRVCLIDDNSFGRLLPTFNVDFSKLPEPIDENVRTLAKLMLLKTYGGMFAPPSFACATSLKSMFRDGVSGGKMFFCENVSRNSTSSIVTTFSSSQFMGCEKKCAALDDCVEYLQSLISRDATAESRFDGNFDRYIFGLQQSGRVNVIPGEHIGIKDASGEPVLIDHIMNDTPIELTDGTCGILIPHDEVLSRIKYKYFAYLSVPEILESESFIGKFLRDLN